MDVDSDREFSHVMSELPSVTTSTVELHANLPTSVNLVREATVGFWPQALCHHQANTYVGSQDAIRGGKGVVYRIDEECAKDKAFIQLDVNDVVCSIVVVNEEIYLLVCKNGGKTEIYVYDFLGVHGRQWKVGVCGNSAYPRMVASQNQILVVDPNEKRISRYTTTGEIIDQIPCGFVSDINGGLAGVGDSTVILSMQDSNAVIRFNLDTGLAMWTSNSIDKPQGVVRYRDSYLMVINQSPGIRIWILDVNTGR